MPHTTLIVRQLGIQPYSYVSDAMHRFTESRDVNDYDQLWLVEHPAVYTQGQAGKPEHLLTSTRIPIIQSDRGGQITYHGPGQQIAYVMVDLKRRKISVRDLVTALEQTVINTLAEWHIAAYARSDAPGVYVNQAKICSLGLRIRRGCSLHGLALNVNMDLSPFLAINPCGYAGMQMTQMSHFVSQISLQIVSEPLIKLFSQQLQYQSIVFQHGSL